MNDLYTQVDFIVSGGALKLLMDFLRSRVSAALVIEPDEGGFQVLDALGTTPESLMIREEDLDLTSLFSQHPPVALFEAEQAQSGGEWPWVVRMRGEHWELYILLKERADESLMADLHPYVGMIRLWRMFQRIDVNEKKLSRLSYMILATKNTLASIFEPMPLSYFASFVMDVLRESLFPRSVAILRDDGGQLTLFTGQADALPERKGIYAEDILPPVPVVTRREQAPYEIVLPIAEGSCRLFCITTWDHFPDPQMLNFLELLGNLAVRAISINHLRTQNREAASYISSSDFAALSLSNVLKALKQEKDYDSFISLAADIFMEQGQMSECLLAIWDEAAQGYKLMEERSGGLKVYSDSTVFSSPRLPVTARSQEAFFSLQGETVDSIFRSWGGGSCPWHEMSSMRYLFPICDDTAVEGFVALASKSGTALDKPQLAALHIVAQFVAYELRRFRSRA